MEMVRISVKSRNNEFIIQVLEFLKSSKDFDVDLEIKEKMSCEFCKLDPFKYAVLLSTTWNDIETLKGLKKWANDNDITDKDNVNCECPIMIACIENHNQCIQTLYDMNYRINIPEDCKLQIDKIIDKNSIPPSETKKYSGMKAFITLKGNSPETDGPNDLVAELLSLKAYTNFHYLAAEFMNEMKDTREERKSLNVSESREKNLILTDPMRKSLALSHYIQTNAEHDVNYRKEYKELKKVSYI